MRHNSMVSFTMSDDVMFSLADPDPLTVCLISAGLASPPCFSRIVRDTKKRKLTISLMISWL